MSSEQIFKDAANIYSRLFNHKAALQGLNQNFVKEFEEKKNESMSLSRSHEWVKDCTDRIQPATQQMLEDHISQVNGAVQKATQTCQSILQDETDKKTKWLEEERARRTEEWKEFIQSQLQARKGDMEQEFKARAEALQKQYSELEEKLSQSGIGKLL